MPQQVSAVGKRFCEDDLKKIQHLENEQSLFRGSVSTSKMYSEREKEAINISSQETFNTMWNELNNEKATFDRNHEKGSGLFSKRYQETSVAVHDFLKDFSPILKVVKDFASPYGNLAFGTISILFVVAKSKHNLEQQLETTISAIKDRLPGLQVYQHIYNEKKELDLKLQRQIAGVYQVFIEYCMLTTKYYKKRSIQRWLSASMSSNPYQAQEDSVKKKITEIRLSCEELLHNRVFEVKIINERILRKNQEQTELIQGLQKSIQDDRVRTFQDALKLGFFSAESHRDDFKHYCGELNSNEQLNIYSLQQMQGDGLRSFKADSEYQAWKVSEEAQFILLWGYNNIGISQEVECWLSPVATSTIDELSHSSYLAYDIIRNGNSAFEVLSVVLLQLLRFRPERLKDESQYSELSSELKIYRFICDEGKDSDKDIEAKLGALQNIAARIISFFDPSDTVYIVIDRVDRCSHRTSNHRKALLDALVKMVEAADCKLKVLAVVNGYDWDSRSYNVERRRRVKRVIVEQLLKY